MGQTPGTYRTLAARERATIESRSTIGAFVERSGPMVVADPSSFDPARRMPPKLVPDGRTSRQGRCCGNGPACLGELCAGRGQCPRMLSPDVWLVTRSMLTWLSSA